jgi:chromosome partitioning protein
MKTVVVTNNKGGVGKTAISVHLAYYLEEQGKSVLVIDLDAQGNTSQTLTAFASGVKTSQLFGAKAPKIPANPGITLIEADPLVADLEQAPKEQVLSALRRVLPLIGKDFDYCVIDTPPATGLRVISALMAAQYAIAPVELDSYSLAGITQLLQTVIAIERQYNPGLVFVGMLANRLNANSASQKAALDELLSNYARYMVPAKIGNRSSIPEALREGVPVWRLRKTAAREAGAEMLEAFKIIGKRIGL